MRSLVPVVAVLALSLACGESDLDRKLEAWCQRCNFYANMAECMEVQRAIMNCTTCPGPSSR